MDPKTLLFWITAAITGAGAMSVLLSQNIVRSAVWLLFTLAGTAGIFFLLGADFVGATQLIIYVGGILVLVVFGVMLTAQGPFINIKVGPAEWAIALVVSLALFGLLVYALPDEQTWARWYRPPAEVQAMFKGDTQLADQTPAQASTSSALGSAFLGVKEATPRRFITGSPFFNERRRVSYFLPFEIVSVHLLVVLIGAAYLARAKRRRGVVS